MKVFTGDPARPGPKTAELYAQPESRPLVVEQTIVILRAIRAGERLRR